MSTRKQVVSPTGGGGGGWADGWMAVGAPTVRPRGLESQSTYSVGVGGGGALIPRLCDSES
jgi:hypothetical protein